MSSLLFRPSRTPLKRGVAKGACFPALAFFLCCAAPGRAEVLVSDPFTDGSRSNAAGGDVQGMVYYASSGTAGYLVVTNDSAGIGSGNALMLSALSTYGHATACFPGVQLTNSGDTIQVTLDFRFGATPANNTWAALRVGLYNSQLTRMASDGANSPSYDDAGYGCYLSNPALAGANLFVYSETAGASDDILGGPSPSGLVAIGGSGTSPACGTTRHTLSLQITRLAGGDLSMLAQIDSGLAAQATVPAADVLTFSFDEFGLGRGNTNTPILIDNLVISSTASTNNTGADFAALRQKWFDYLTGGTNLNLSDSTIQNAIKNITNSANNYWLSLDKSPTRSYLWSDAASTTVSSHLTTCFNRLYAMALGWAVTGSSLYSNASLQADLLSALNWMNTNRYNATNSKYGNWWDWEIGSPMALVDTCTVLYPALNASRLSAWMAAVNKFSPVPSLTGANLIWKARVVGVRGALVEDPAKLTLVRDAFSQVFPYVTSGDGFYTDGSFVQHGKHPYTGGYGTALIGNLAPLLPWLKGSPWEVVDPRQTNVVAWVFDSYQPLLYRGAMMDIVRGRELSRSGSLDHGTGHNIMQSILRVSGFANPADAGRMRSLVKALAQSDSSRDFAAGCPLSLIPAAKALMADTNVVPRPDLVAHYQFPSMDRVVHLRPGFGLALGLYSTRIYNYESINGENLHNWFSGSGMTYLYNADLTHYSDSFWCTIDPYRLPGTTVPAATRSDGYGQSQVSSYNWVGGSVLDDTYGVAGMELGTYGGTLTARKSWFCFDDEIVALGAGITGGDAAKVESIAENRMLTTAGTNAFTVDGVVQSAALGWSNTFAGLSWAHLVGDVAGSDIGYYFPEPVTVQSLREARTGSWSQINTNGSTTAITRNYLTLWFDHGVKPTNATYAYALLPNKTASAMSAYAASPDIEVVENSEQAQAVRETRLRLFAANFWTAATKTVDFVTCDNKASVIARETFDDLKVAVSDPTRTNAGTVTVTLDRAALAVASADAGMSVTRLSPTIQLTVSMSGRRGQPATARFLYYTNTAPVLDPVENKAVPGGAALSVTNAARDPDSVPQQLRYSLLAAPPGAAINPTNGVVTWRSPVTGAAASNLFTVVVTEAGWVTNLAALADTYARDGSYAAVNYGTETSLTVKLSSSGLTREAYLKFEIPPMHGSAAEARLRLMPDYASAPATHAVAAVADSTWGETTLTWSNKPLSSSMLASWVPQAGTGVDVPVTAAVLQTGGPAVSLRVFAQNSTSDGFVTYASRETATNTPALMIVSTNLASQSATQSFWVMVSTPPAPAVTAAGVSNAAWFMEVNAVPGPDAIIEASTNLLNWAVLQITNSPIGRFLWVDPDMNRPSRRFYRVRLGP